MTLWQCLDVNGPWLHGSLATYILEEPEDVFEFVLADTGQSHVVSLRWDSNRIRENLMRMSVQVCPAQWPEWFHPDALRDIGL